jgi:hypothetical protein
MRCLIFVGVTLSFLTACTAPSVDPAASTDVQAPVTVTGSSPSRPANPCNPALQPFGGGNGTLESPNMICTAAQLQNLAVSPYNGQHARLEADVGAQSVTNLGDFSGTLDGNGHVLGGFHATTPATSAGCGLFATLYGTVKNLDMTYMSINCPSYAAGSVAAMVATTGVVDNVTVHDSSVTGNSAVGSIAGSVAGSATHVFTWTTTLTSPYGSGGLVGQVLTGAIVTGNSASGTYSATSRSGFVVGILQGSLTCITGPAGHTYAAIDSVGYNVGTATGCP